MSYDEPTNYDVLALCKTYVEATSDARRKAAYDALASLYELKLVIGQPVPPEMRFKDLPDGVGVQHRDGSSHLIWIKDADRWRGQPLKANPDGTMSREFLVVQLP